MRKILIVITALGLAGCSTPFGERVSSFVSVVKSAATGTVSPEAIYIARNAFDTAEVSATNYLNLKRCPTNAPFCRSPVATAKLIPAIRAGRQARNAATAFLDQHPGQLGTQGLYDGLVSATDTIKAILAQYNVGN